MRIKSIQIENFRCLHSISTTFDTITMLLGRNGAGKSTILHALDVFYNVSYQPVNDDFFQRNTDTPIVIRVTYSDLTQQEQAEFSIYMQDQDLTITKKIDTAAGSQYYANTRQNPDFKKIRDIQNKNERKKAYADLQSRSDYADLPKATTADACESFMHDYEIKHPGTCILIENKTQFFGPPSIGGGKLDKFTKYVLIPAVKEVSSELMNKGRTYLQQLLDIVILKQIEAREDVKVFKQEFEQKIKKIYSSENLIELPKVGQEISDILEKYAPGTSFHLSWGEIKPPEIKLPPAESSMTEDGFRGEIDKKGHGLQRSLLFAMLEYLNKILPNNIVEPPSAATPQQSSPSIILAIEEPELYQHPQKSKYLATVLRNLVNSGEMQVICTTHSPYFINLDTYKSIRLVRKILTSEAKTCGEVYAFSEEDFSSKLRDNNISNDPISFIAHSSPIMTSMTNEGFFADGIVLVEGLSDYGYLWALQDILKQNWIQRGISIIPVNGKDNLHKPALIFRGLNIPCYVVFDSDKKNNGNDKKNKKILKVIDQPERDCFQTIVTPNWACFFDKVETYIKDELGDNFSVIADILCETLGYTNADELFKNIMGSEQFIRKAYEKGHKLPKLEDVVYAITKIVS